MNDFPGCAMGIMALSLSFFMFVISIAILADLSGCRSLPAAKAEVE